MVVERSDDAQDVLVVLVVADCRAIGLKERNILGTGELTGELVDVDSLVIRVNLLKGEGLLRHEVYDVLFVVKAYHGAIHPTLVLSYEGEIGVWMVEQELKETVVIDEVALDEEGVVLLQLLLGQGQRIDIVGLVVDRILNVFDGELVVIAMAKVVDEVLTLVSDDDNNTSKSQRR